MSPTGWSRPTSSGEPGAPIRHSASTGTTGLSPGPISATCRQLNVSTPSPPGAARRPIAVWETGDVAQALNATSNFLTTLGTGPYLGRMFTTAEDDTASDSILISYRVVAAPLRRRRSASSDVRSRLDDVPRTIVGVLAPRFQYEGEPPEFLLPFGNLTAGERSDNYAYRVVARLAAGCDAGAGGESDRGDSRRRTRAQPTDVASGHGS